MSEICATAIHLAASINNLSLCRLLVEYGANPQQQDTVRPPRPCCRSYGDAHPHLELDPMYYAVQNENLHMLQLLCAAAPKVPYYFIKLLEDVVFRTGYAQEVSMNQKSLVQLASFFTLTRCNVPQLMSLCRGVIRKQLGSNPARKVKQLEIPTRLKEYVLLTSLLEHLKKLEGHQAES
jgi:hypothetical protein